MTLDGWSNVKNDPIQSVTFHNAIKSYLLEVYNSGSQKNISEQWASIVESVVKECHENLHADIFVSVTDNENKMEKTWDI